MVKVLVAEDDQLNRDVLVRYLQNEGYQTLEVSDGMAALRLAREGVDLAIVDLGLPAIDGLNVIRSLRSDRCSIPIMVVSARVDEVDRIVAFEVGADDYVPKPFLPREVVWRTRALLRRAGQKPQADRTMRFGPLEIDEAAREVRVDGAPINIRPREFSLLATMAAHPGVAMARKTLIERAWGYDYAGDDRTVDGHIRRIRQKLERFPTVPPLIATIYGYGYKFIAAA